MGVVDNPTCLSGRDRCRENGEHGGTMRHRNAAKAKLAMEWLAKSSQHCPCTVPHGISVEGPVVEAAVTICRLELADERVCQASRPKSLPLTSTAFGQ